MQSLVLFTRQLCAAGLALGFTAAGAATYTVTQLGDGGAGSLREAVSASNANPGPDTIRFAVSGTIRLQAPLAVTDDLSIDGEGQRVVLNGGGQHTVLQLLDEIKRLEVARLTIEAAGYSQSLGGAISARGNLRVVESLILDSLAPMGGAIYSAGAHLEVLNSTFARNRALSWGGAIAIGASTEARIVHSTFVGNDAAQFGGALFQNPIAAAQTRGGSMVISNSIISGVAAKGNCSVISNRLIDGGGNLNSDGSCPFTAAKGSVNHTHPALDDLRDHGGPTRSFAPLPGSPAVDSGATSQTRQSGLLRDQRGYRRVAGSQVDKGAFEVQAGDAVAATLERPLQQPVLFTP